jgi:hypothetical protein
VLIAHSGEVKGGLGEWAQVSGRGRGSTGTGDKYAGWIGERAESDMSSLKLLYCPSRSQEQRKMRRIQDRPRRGGSDEGKLELRVTHFVR